MNNVHVQFRDMDAYPTVNIQPETKNNPFSTLLERKEKGKKEKERKFTTSTA